MEDVWYFAPRVSQKDPYDVVICLIWTSPFLKERPRNTTNEVSLEERIILLNIIQTHKLPQNIIQKLSGKNEHYWILLFSQHLSFP